MIPVVLLIYQKSKTNVALLSDNMTNYTLSNRLGIWIIWKMMHILSWDIFPMLLFPVSRELQNLHTQNRSMDWLKLSLLRSTLTSHLKWVETSSPHEYK